MIMVFCNALERSGNMHIEGCSPTLFLTIGLLASYCVLFKYPSCQAVSNLHDINISSCAIHGGRTNCAPKPLWVVLHHPWYWHPGCQLHSLLPTNRNKWESLNTLLISFRRVNWLHLRAFAWKMPSIASCYRPWRKDQGHWLTSWRGLDSGPWHLQGRWQKHLTGKVKWRKTQLAGEDKMITIQSAKKVFHVGPLLTLQRCILAWVGVSCGIFVDYAVFCVWIFWVSCV